jgi:hypothetical protein
MLPRRRRVLRAVQPSPLHPARPPLRQPATPYQQPEPRLGRARPPPSAVKPACDRSTVRPGARPQVGAAAPSHGGCRAKPSNSSLFVSSIGRSRTSAIDATGPARQVERPRLSTAVVAIDNGGCCATASMESSSPSRVRLASAGRLGCRESSAEPRRRSARGGRFRPARRCRAAAAVRRPRACGGGV